MVEHKNFKQIANSSFLRSVLLTGILFLNGCYNTGNIPVMRSSKNSLELSVTQLAEKVEKSVVHMNYQAVYKKYRFLKTDEITEARLENRKILKKFKPEYLREPSSGTATVISASENEVILVSTLHIVNSPEVIIHKFPKSEIIKTYSVLDDYSLNFSKIIEEDVVELGRDKVNDLVLFRVKAVEHEVVEVGMNFVENAKISIGTEAYVIGYPLGNKLITSALITPSEFNDSILLLDANFNRGYSGGLVFGMVRDSDHPQILGLATSAYASYLNILVPDSDMIEIDLLEDEYEGTIRVKKEEKLNYGVTMMVSGEVVGKFVEKNR